MSRSEERLGSALRACATGAAPPNVALMRLLMEAGSGEEARAALAAALGGAEEQEARTRLAAALDLLAAHPEAFATVKAVISHAPHDTDELGPDDWAEIFDRLAELSPDAGSALYALGSPALLAKATEEVVQAMGGWSLLGPDCHVLEIGCGSGRFLEALAPLCARVTGLDVSAAMLGRAATRCAPFGNVRLERSSGRDLAGIPDASVDLVLAADVFPYLVAASQEVAAAHVREAGRVLRPGAALVILNYSYRGDLARDRRELSAELLPAGFDGLSEGAGEFAFWDARRFLARRRAA